MYEDDDFTFRQVAPAGEPSASGVIPLTRDVSRLSIGGNASHITPGEKNLSPLWRDQQKDGSARKNTSFGRKAVKRVMVPLEMGYSQMDWFKLTMKHPYIGFNESPELKSISMDEVRQHQVEGSMWTVLKGRVYDIYPYLKFHPGGVDMLMKAVGKDCTSLFNEYHPWVSAEFLLEECVVGMLYDGEDEDEDLLPC